MDVAKASCRFRYHDHAPGSVVLGVEGRPQIPGLLPDERAQAEQRRVAGGNPELLADLLACNSEVLDVPRSRRTEADGTLREIADGADEVRDVPVAM